MIVCNKIYFVYFDDLVLASVSQCLWYFLGNGVFFSLVEALQLLENKELVLLTRPWPTLESAGGQSIKGTVPSPAIQRTTSERRAWAGEHEETVHDFETLWGIREIAEVFLQKAEFSYFVGGFGSQINCVYR